jgi:hypothetical protein
MKRILTIFTLVILIAATHSAVAGDMPIGFKAGLNMGRLRGDDIEDPSFRYGFSVGGYVELPLTPMLSAVGEVSYATKGGKATCTYTSPGFDDHAIEIDETYKLNYVVIPVLLKLNIPTSGDMMPYILAGPSFSINVGADFEESGDGWSEEMDIGDFVKTFDIGAVFGGGVKFPFASRMMSLGARYDMGLSTIDDGLAEEWNMDEVDVKNGVISILAGLEL